MYNLIEIDDISIINIHNRLLANKLAIYFDYLLKQCRHGARIHNIQIHFHYFIWPIACVISFAKYAAVFFENTRCDWSCRMKNNIADMTNMTNNIKYNWFIWNQSSHL